MSWPALLPCHLVQVFQDFPFDIAKAAAAVFSKKDTAILSKSVGIKRLASLNPSRWPRDWDVLGLLRTPGFIYGRVYTVQSRTINLYVNPVGVDHNLIAEIPLHLFGLTMGKKWSDCCGEHHDYDMHDLNAGVNPVHNVAAY